MKERDPLLDSIPRVRDRYVVHDLGHVVAILRLLEEHPHYFAERTVARYFQEHPRLGSSDRTLIGGLVFTVVRWRRRIDEAIARVLGSDERMRQVEARILAACGALLALAGYTREAISAGLSAGATGGPSGEALASRMDDVAQAVGALNPMHAASPRGLALTASLPDWAVERWIDQYGWERAKSLAIAIQSIAPVTLRVNLLRARRDEVLDALAGEGTDARPTDLSPWGVLLGGPVQLRGSPLYRDGKIEFQDEGSQVVVWLTGAKPGMRVVDACAGSGGKTLALAAMMENRGELLALDVDARKLVELRKRARRAGVGIVTTAHANDRAAYASWAETADIVLADAPCSGSGAWRRVPDGPAHVTYADLARLARAQHDILTRYSWLVRPGGRLVYATCSLFREENQEVVERWLTAHAGFRLLDVRQCLPASIAEVATEGPFLTLAPDRCGTDGFFAAVVERVTGAV